MSGDEIWFAVLSGLAVNECCDLSPWVARKLIRLSARLRYPDPTLAEQRAEELTALLDDRPGKLFKLCTALGFVMAGLSRAAARNTRRPFLGGGLTIRWTVLTAGFGLATTAGLSLSTAVVKRDLVIGG